MFLKPGNFITYLNNENACGEYGPYAGHAGDVIVPKSDSPIWYNYCLTKKIILSAVYKKKMNGEIIHN